MDIFLLVAPSASDGGGDDGDDDLRGGEDEGGSTTSSSAEEEEGREKNAAKRSMPGSPPHPSRVAGGRIKRHRGGAGGSRSRRGGGGGDDDDDDDGPRDPSPRDLDSDVPVRPNTTAAAITTSQRLAEARSRRRALQELRVRSLRDRTSARLRAAARRLESHLRTRTARAREVDGRIAAVKERRAALLESRRLSALAASEEREARARSNVEAALESRRERARSEVTERVRAARERRSELESARAASALRDMTERSESASARAECRLAARRERAGAALGERAARARDRRSLLRAERRAALLASLDYRARRASMSRRTGLEGRRERAGTEVRRARMVSSRVRAARVLQGAARSRFGFAAAASAASEPAGRGLSQNGAARRLQAWRRWRERVSARRFLSDGGGDEDGPADDSPRESLGTILSMTEPDSGDRKPSFERVRAAMTRASTLRAARDFLRCLRPVRQPTELNDRTLLSAFLICAHPDEVLGGGGGGGDPERGAASCAAALRRSSADLVASVRDLADALRRGGGGGGGGGRAVASAGETGAIVEVVRRVSVRVTAYAALFHLWKDADLNGLVEQMVASATQSWVAYLSSNEALAYMEERTATTTTTTKTSAGDAGTSRTIAGGSAAAAAAAASAGDDPLLSIRLRHEAQRSGAKSHIKRIRASLNKLVGIEEGRRIVRGAREAARRRLEADGSAEAMRGEVAELLGEDGRADAADRSSRDDDGGKVEARENPGRDGTSGGAEPSRDGAVPNEILSDERLVHAVLLADPGDLGRLTWDGEPAREEEDVVAAEEFMSSWAEERRRAGADRPDRASTEPDRALDDVRRRVADAMRLAFFDRVAEEMERGRYGPVRDVLLELHGRVRALVPNRADLHSHLRDEDAGRADDARSVLDVLLRAADALGGHLEAPARAPSTEEWMRSASERRDGKAAAGGGLPYGFESEERYLAASAAFLLRKAELCRADVANFRLREVAPLIRRIGRGYELDRLNERYGPIDYSSAASIADRLPATAAWVRGIVARPRPDGPSDEAAPASAVASHGRRMALVRTRGFVDGLLLLSGGRGPPLALPEVLGMDAERIARVRDGARRAAVGSALALHARSASGAGAAAAAAPNRGGAPGGARTEGPLSAALRAEYASREELVRCTTEAVVALAHGLSGRDLDAGRETVLRSRVSAVLSGDDPVLKLLHNRAGRFFRFACRWEPPPPSAPAPVPMRTGRPVLGGGGGGAASSSASSPGTSSAAPSFAAAFAAAAGGEASKLGFAPFADELAEAGAAARAVIDLCCMQYGRKILDPVMLDAIRGGGVDSR